MSIYISYTAGVARYSGIYIQQESSHTFTHSSSQLTATIHISGPHRHTHT